MKKRVLKTIKAAAKQTGVKPRALKKYFKLPENRKELHEVFKPAKQ